MGFEAMGTVFFIVPSQETNVETAWLLIPEPLELWGAVHVLKPIARFCTDASANQDGSPNLSCLLLIFLWSQYLGDL